MDNVPPWTQDLQARKKLTKSIYVDEMILPPLTKLQFRRKLRQANLSQRKFAKLTQTNVRTVNRWAQGVIRVPHWARLLLDLIIERGGL
jgi:DNA-binding transcriptional regulator YiaG